MHTTVRWHSQAGSTTADNRDALGFTDHAGLNIYLMADGSSSHPHSGELAAALIDKLITAVKGWPAMQLNAQQLSEMFLQSVANARQMLSKEFPVSACSYLILCLMDNAALSIHEGDCCLGVMGANDTITWLSNVHCASNWQGNLSHTAIARQSSRHRLTRCFSARRESNPEVSYWPDPLQHWVLASDGFWACLSSEAQQNFMRTNNLQTAPIDDTTYISIRARHP